MVTLPVTLPFKYFHFTNNFIDLIQSLKISINFSKKAIAYFSCTQFVLFVRFVVRLIAQFHLMWWGGVGLHGMVSYYHFPSPKFY